MLTGCAQRGLGAGLFSAEGLRAESSLSGAILDLRPRTAVYLDVDEQSADLYLTDLTADAIRRLAEGDSTVLTEDPPLGSIVHIHLFLLPRAGRTPIDFNANNFTLTQLVFAGVDPDGQAAIGQYGGGGFLLPNAFRGELGDDRFQGAIRSATLTFIDGTPGFVDRLDGASVSGSIRTDLDSSATQSVAAAMRRVLQAMP